MNYPGEATKTHAALVFDGVPGCPYGPQMWVLNPRASKIDRNLMGRGEASANHAMIGSRIFVDIILFWFDLICIYCMILLFWSIFWCFLWPMQVYEQANSLNPERQILTIYLHPRSGWWDKLQEPPFFVMAKTMPKTMRSYRFSCQFIDIISYRWMSLQ